MKIRRLDPLLYFPAVIMTGMVALGGLAWVYEKTRRKFVHPRWGTLTLEGDRWRFMVPHYRAGEPAVTVELLGGKTAPDEEEIERFEALWGRVADLVEKVRPLAIEDLHDAYDAVLGDSFETQLRPIVERVAADPSALDADWKLASIRVYQGSKGQKFWSLEFEPSWDEEHQRSAYFDLEDNVVLYDLSVAVVDL